MTQTLCSRGDSPGGNAHLVPAVAFGGNNTAGPIQVSTAINAHGGPHGGPHGRLDFESETFVLSGDFADYRPDQAAAVRAGGGDVGGGSEVLVCHGTMDPCSQTELAYALGRNNGGENVLAFSCKDHGADVTKDVAPTMRAMGHSGSHANAGGQLAVCITGDVTHTLRGEGFDASEDGTGRGQPIVTWPILEPGARTGVSTTDPRAGMGIGGEDDPMFTLQAGKQHGICIAFQAGNIARGAGAGPSTDTFPTLNANHGRGLSDQHPCVAIPAPRVTPAIAYDFLGTPATEVAKETDVHTPLRARVPGQFENSTVTTVLAPRHEEFTIPLRASGAANADGAGIGRDGDPCLTLDCDGSAAVAFQASQSGMRLGDGVHPTLDSNNGSRRHHGALIGSAVRRLTPQECERLQGFPDSYTAIPWKKHGPEDCPDGLRYKALGNSMNAKVMSWIGGRIAMVEAEHNAAQDLFGDLPAQPFESPTLFDI